MRCAPMKPLAEMSVDALRKIRGVLFDIDDTLTTRGSLTAEAYAALETLHLAGFLAIAITGRPAGWCDHIARMWPVDAVVGENGAFYFCFDRDAKKMRQRFIKDEMTRAADRARLADVAREILAGVPGTALASDQAYREADIAIDFCEDVPALPAREVQRIRTLMENAGLTAKVSSIHVNGWLGQADTLSTTRLLLRERFDIDIDLEPVREQFVFIGDSPNDAPMFGFFPQAVGVANVRAFVDQLAAKPAWVTEGECGRGFAEVVARLIAARLA
jgi:HAD superfamily hydrolase (TIGR01484 family)